MKVKYVKTNKSKTLKILLTITDACVKTAVLARCSEEKTKVSLFRVSVVGTFKNICTVAVHCWYIKDAFAGFC